MSSSGCCKRGSEGPFAYPRVVPLYNTTVLILVRPEGGLFKQCQCYCTNVIVPRSDACQLIFNKISVICQNFMCQNYTCVMAVSCERWLRAISSVMLPAKATHTIDVLLQYYTTEATMLSEQWRCLQPTTPHRIKHLGQCLVRLSNNQQPRQGKTPRKHPY